MFRYLKIFCKKHFYGFIKTNIIIKKWQNFQHGSIQLQETLHVQNYGRKNDIGYFIDDLTLNHKGSSYFKKEISFLDDKKIVNTKYIIDEWRKNDYKHPKKVFGEIFIFRKTDENTIDVVEVQLSVVTSIRLMHKDQ